MRIVKKTMKCPKCGNEKKFLIAISATAMYDAEDDTLYDFEDMMIDDRELVTCKICNHVGTMDEFETKGE